MLSFEYVTFIPPFWDKIGCTRLPPVLPVFPKKTT